MGSALRTGTFDVIVIGSGKPSEASFAIHAKVMSHYLGGAGGNERSG